MVVVVVGVNLGGFWCQYWGFLVLNFGVRYLVLLFHSVVVGTCFRCLVVVVGGCCW